MGARRKRLARMRIAIYRGCGIGDFVQITPLLQQVRADFPEARVTLFTSENVADLLGSCPWIDHSSTFRPDLLGTLRGRLGGLPIWRRIDREGPWDLLLSLEPHWRRAAGACFVHATRRGGLQTEGWKPLRIFDETYALRRDGRNLGHASLWYLKLWQRLTGQTDRGYGCDVRYLLNPPLATPEMPARAVCLAPGAGNVMTPAEGKRWPLESWMRLAKSLEARSFSPIWLGSNEDAATFSNITLKGNFMGRLALRQTAGVIARSRALIGNDSGLFHLALGLGTPGVGLFGPTDPQNTGPFRSPQALVFKAGFGIVPPLPAATDIADLQSPQPMTLLDAEEVISAVGAFLEPVSTS
jgi:heptosyltransferase-1